MTWGVQGGGVQRKSTHRVLMNFFLREGWQISFLEEDCKTSLPLKLTFATADKIIEMHERWGERRMLEDRSILVYAIEQGRGTVWLTLTTEQYTKLKKR